MTTQNYEKVLRLIAEGSEIRQDMMDVIADLVRLTRSLENRIIKLEHESNENRPGVTTDKA